MKKLLSFFTIYFFVFSSYLYSQETLNTVTSRGNFTPFSLRVSGLGTGDNGVGPSGESGLVLGVLNVNNINDTRAFVGWKNSSNTLTNGLAGTLMLQSRSDISTPIDFLTGVGTPQLRMRITGSGNVGIGTSDPSYRLDVQNGVINVGSGANNFYKAGYLSMGNSTFGNFPYIAFNATLTTSDATNHLNSFTPFYNQGSGIIIRGEGGTSALHFLQKNYANGTPPYDLNSFTEALTLTTSGTLGIGTTDTKGYKLAVNGSAIFTKAVVKNYSNWPDYVFEPTYILPSLQSVKNFIDENGHLPEIPSAVEVEKKGVNLGENQALLLKKIEELTLYVIDQNKRNDQQQELIEKQNRLLEEQARSLKLLEERLMKLQENK